MRGEAAGHRAHVDQVGDPTRFGFGGSKQVGQCGVRAVLEAEQVELDHPPPLLDRRVDDRAEQHHPGVVDQDVETAELADGAIDRSVRLFLVGHVGLEDEGLRLASLGPDPLGQRLEPILAPGGDRHRGAGVRERLGRRFADAARRAGDQCDGSLQLFAHRALLSLRPTPGARLVSAARSGHQGITAARAIPFVGDGWASSAIAAPHAAR